MHGSWSKIVIGGLIAVVVLGGAVWASTWLWSNPKNLRPALVEVPPLAPVARSSVIVTPGDHHALRHPRRDGDGGAAQSRRQA